MDKNNKLKLKMDVRWVLFITVSVLCSSCTVIETHGETSSVEYYFGFPIIKLKEQGGLLQYSTKSYGLGLSNQNFTIGYYEKFLVSLDEPEKCSAVIFVKSKEELDKIESHLKSVSSSLNNLCVYRGE